MSCPEGANGNRGEEDVADGFVAGICGSVVDAKGMSRANGKMTSL